MGEKTSLHKVDVSEKETKFEKFTNDVKNFFEWSQRVSRNNTLNTLEHTEHAQNTPQNFCEKLKQKQHAQNTPQYFSLKLKQKQHARNTPRTRPRFFQKYICVLILIAKPYR